MAENEEKDPTDQAREAILKKIAKLAPDAGAVGLHHLAEAYAWTVYPNQPHGGFTQQS